MLLAVPFGLAIGVAVGMLGGGGSVLAVPVLVYVLGQSVSEATTASLVVVTAGAVAGGLGHARAGRVCWRHAGSFTMAAVPGLVAGVMVGFLTGFFGVGGGFLIVPTLAIALAFTMRTAVGTSLAVITATSLIGLAVHLLAGRSLEVGVTTAMTGACVVGALAGAGLATHVPQRTLGRAFALLVCCVAAYLLVSAAFLGGPPTS